MSVMSQLKTKTTGFDWSIKFSGPVIQGVKINFPVNAKFQINWKEFSQIGTLIQSLDNLIVLHQRELSKLHNMKKAMLENMFI